jgi:hypothetical protein
MIHAATAAPASPPRKNTTTAITTRIALPTSPSIERDSCAAALRTRCRISAPYPRFHKLDELRSFVSCDLFHHAMRTSRQEYPLQPIRLALYGWRRSATYAGIMSTSTASCCTSGGSRTAPEHAPDPGRRTPGASPASARESGIASRLRQRAKVALHHAGPRPSDRARGRGRRPRAEGPPAHVASRLRLRPRHLC